MLKLEFETDNAAFDGAGRIKEAARILRYVASMIDRGSHGARIKDENGNTIGHFQLDREA